MKLVIGIVRPEKANDVLEALYRAEVRGVSISRVQGHGGELDRVETYRGTTVQVGLSDKVRFEVAVSDDFVDATIEALCAGARTGEVGDEGAVDLDLAERERAQIAEARVAGAEVVERDAHAERGKPFEHRAHPGFVVQQDGLGDLQFKPLWREVRG